MKNKRKIIFYIINIFIIFAVFWLTIYKIIEENGIETFSYIKNLSFLSVAILTIVFLINYYLDGIIMSISMKEYKGDFSSSQGFVVQSVGGLFSAITPLKVGYLPSIGYAYSRFGVNPEKVIKSMAKTSYTYQILCLIISIVSFFVCINKEMIIYFDDNSLNLKYVAIIGLGYNIFLMVGYFVLVLSPFLHEIIVKIVAWILFKIKKINDKDGYVLEKVNKMAIIRGEIRNYFKDVKQFIKLFVLYFVKTIIYGALPYIVYLLVTKDTFKFEMWVYTIIIRDLISYITNIIPIPGASGAAEVVFVAAFSLLFFPNSILNSVMLIWRFFSYFINIIVGFIVFVILCNVKKKSKAAL